MKLRTLSPTAVKNKAVLVRVDFNVPLKEKNGKTVITDDLRIKAAFPTIQLLQENNAKIILCSHLGRPGGKDNSKLSLEPVAKHLSKLLNTPVKFTKNCVGEIAQKAVQKLKPREVLLLENLRFHPDEEKNEAEFAEQLSSLATIYVNDAFSTSHRSHASVVGIPKHLPAYAGISLHKEVEALQELIVKPKRPFVMVIGGAKISDKVAAIENLTKIADAVLVGGGVANNFLKAEGFEIAKSYLQDTPADLKKKGVDYVEVAEDLIEETKHDRIFKDGYIPLPKIMYPIDVKAAASMDKRSSKTIELVNGERKEAIKKNLMFLDIGPKTIKLFQDVILQAGTIFWNGPMGVFENPEFEDGTREIAQTIAKSSATTILGGGDTISAIRHFKLEDRYNYVSAAGGASLEFLSGKMLPGIKPLLKK